MPSNRAPEPLLTAPKTKPNVSVARMTDYWYVACRSEQLKGRKPRAVTILGIPLVLFRAANGAAGALLDRCPHRNVPLSIGEVKGQSLECPYHGWQFDTKGTCKHVPGLVEQGDQRGRSAVAYPIREQQGFVWVFTNPDIEPAVDPFWIPHLDRPGYSHVRHEVDAGGTLHATIENALDVPHTSFLHKGLFRGTGTRNDITAIVRRWPDRVEAEYVGEPRPKGVAARLLSPSGGEVSHFDRFFLPSVSQVDYELGGDSHICVTALGTPVSDFETKLFAVVSFRLKHVPHWAIKPLLMPLALKIFSQDAKVLKLQTKAIGTFGGEQFVSTDIDVLGPHIWRLMKTAERGAVLATDDPPFEKRIPLNV